MLGVSSRISFRNKDILSLLAQKGSSQRQFDEAVPDAEEGRPPTVAGQQTTIPPGQRAANGKNQDVNGSDRT